MLYEKTGNKVSENEELINEETIKKEIGKRLKDLRKERKLSQDKLADKLDVNHKSISSYETGKTEIPLRLLYRYVKIFGVSADYILFGNDSGVISKELLISFISNN